jgi:hypothetical protein
MIAASDCVFKCGKNVFTMRIGPLKLISISRVMSSRLPALSVHLSLIAARDKNRVTKCRELFGEFVTDAAATACDQNRIAREFHNSSASITSASLPSSFFMVPILTGCSLICVSQGPDPVFKPLCLHHHHLRVVGAERNGRHTLKGGEEMDRQFS